MRLTHLKIKKKMARWRRDCQSDCPAQYTIQAYVAKLVRAIFALKHCNMQGCVCVWMTNTLLRQSANSSSIIYTYMQNARILDKSAK